MEYPILYILSGTRFFARFAIMEIVRHERSLVMSTKETSYSVSCFIQGRIFRKLEMTETVTCSSMFYSLQKYFPSGSSLARKISLPPLLVKELPKRVVLVHRKYPVTRTLPEGSVVVELAASKLAPHNFKRNFDHVLQSIHISSAIVSDGAAVRNDDHSIVDLVGIK